ncbi:glycosyltransferase [Acinetobacter sp. ANC 4282]|nr:glycosyltransferase [Acinetobacter terrae]NNH16644.1 glycosyltransferase [Acinetobacter terrae]
MILLDSVYINTGGGLVLLKYLVDCFESAFDNVFYLFDKRTENIFKKIPLEKKMFISNSILERYFFYKKNKHQFNKVICFGNLPPNIRLNAKVFVYFHQKLFLEIPGNFSIKNKFIIFFKQNILNFIKNNTDYWLVQSNTMKIELAKKYFNGFSGKIVKLPFYPKLEFSKLSVPRIAGSLLYVSNSSPHKNHYKLIESFCLAYDEINKSSLTITVPISDVNLCDLIKEKINLGYPIINVGFIEREKLAELYLSHEYLIFPSLAESFGLGLAEAIDGGCKIIAADLNYTYEVCEPSLVFNPYSVESMKNAIVTAVQNELPYAQKLIENDISKIMQLLAD